MNIKDFIRDGFTAQGYVNGHLILTDGKTVIAVDRDDKLAGSVAIGDNSYAETLALLQDKIKST